jgi:Acetyl-CoA dehydrogenase C-terminal like
LQHVGAATKSAWSTGNPNEALANAVPYMQAFGQMVIAWVWLDVALCFAKEPHPHPTLPLEGEGKFREGKLAACNYFFAYEVPKIEAWLAVVKTRDMTCANISADAF